MLKEERQRRIETTLRRNGKVLAVELAAELGVSDDTIRRDLSELAAAGVLQRVHGGALPTSPAVVPYAEREQQAPEAKLAIARAAAGMIRDGQAVILDGGTTARLVAQHLPRELRATVITNSPTTADALMEHPGVDIVLIGGRVFKEARVAVGAATVEALQMLRADIYLLGVGGLHPELGLSTGDLEEALVKRTMIARSAEVVALASSEKLGTGARYVVGPVTELTHVITDRGAAEEQVDAIRRLGVTVIQAGEAEP